jgi:hypothetical protein
MRFGFEQPIRAPRQVVEQAFDDPDFYAALGSMPNVGLPDVLDRSATDGIVTMRVRYAFTGSLAAPARAVLDPAKLTWIIESVTEPNEHGARFRMIPDHYPDRLECQGDYRFVEESEASTRQLFEGDLVVHFPLVGAMVERAILTGMRQHMAAQATVVEQWAAAHRRREQS